MQDYQYTELAKVYGNDYVANLVRGDTQLKTSRGKTLKSSLLVDRAIACLLEKLSIDFVIKELSFATVALVTYLYMQNSGRLSSLSSFGYLIEIMLLVAMGYNLFKASLRSLAPGFICLVGGLVCFPGGIHQHYFKFLTLNNIDYIIGMGAFLIGLSLMRSDNKN